MAAIHISEGVLTPDNVQSTDDDLPLVTADPTSNLCSRLSKFKDVLAATIACLGAVSMGMVLGYSNPALLDEKLLRVLKNDDEKMSWFGSLVAIGAIFGGPIAALFVGSMGRKTTQMLITVPMAMGWFMIIYGYEYIIVYCGRIMTGVAMGMVSLAVPLYVAEVSDKSRRGVLGAGFQLFVTIGILLVYSIGPALDNYNWLAAACLSVSTLNVLLLLIVPETPRWYVLEKDRNEALKSLAWLKGKDGDLEQEYNDIELSLMSQSGEGIGFRDVLQPGIYKPMLICFGLMFFQQMSGINAVIFYSAQIFKTSGFTNPVMPMVITGAVLVGATIISCVFMDVVGRRILLLLSGAVMTLSIVALGVYYYLTEVKNVGGLSWLSLTSLVVFVVAFSFGWGPIPWLVTSEIIPMRARGVVNGLATCINWALVFLTTKEFSQLEHSVHAYGAFWIFGGFCFVGCFFVWFFLPETKGRSLEEIQDQFEFPNES